MQHDTERIKDEATRDTMRVKYNTTRVQHDPF